MGNIDDIGMVVVWNQAGSSVLEAKWSSGGTHGSTTGDLDQMFVVGENYIVFLLYNTPFESWGIFQGGKWSYSFALEQDGRILWSQSDRQNDNTRGIKFMKVFRALVARDGGISISEPTPGDPVLETLESNVHQLRKRLDQTVPPSKPF